MNIMAGIPRSRRGGRRFLLALSFALLTGVSPPVRAATAAGSTGAAFLQLGVGARASGMGEANTAWADDVFGVFFNPAGIARTRTGQLGFVHHNLFADVSYDYAGYLYPFKEKGALAVSAQFVDLGKIDRTTVASGINNQIVGSATADDLALALTYSRIVAPWVDLGLTLRYIHENLDRFSANAVAVDIGGKVFTPVEGLTVGVSLANVGTSLKFVREEEDLPITMRVGAGYRPPGSRWSLAGDAVWVRNENLEGKFGVEYWIWPEHFAVRGGINTATDEGSGLTAGAQFRWQGLDLDYAFVPFGDLGNEHIVSLAYEIGPKRSRKEEKAETKQLQAVPPERGKTGKAGNMAKQPERERESAPGTKLTRVSEREASTRKRTEPVSNVEEKTVQPVPAAEVPPAVYVANFEYKSGREEYAWLGEAIPIVLADGWRGRYLYSADGTGARYRIEGSYQVEGTAITVSAHLYKEGRLIDAFVWTGSVTESARVWDWMIADLSKRIEEDRR
ncbi:MAG: hypothetical protein D6679_11350 [Candidatus Hydrogenedentota bacterium]|nr:MAG: hypothetical protein D6679_11350 [Candidatus Hydrogenedentota bacterium]